MMRMARPLVDRESRLGADRFQRDDQCWRRSRDKWPMEDRRSIPIRSDKDILRAREQARELAGQWGASARDQTLVAAAVSELARNIILYAKEGEIVLEHVADGHRPGIVVVARDEGPGIQDLDAALGAGYSTSGGLGMGLSGVRRLMDEFDIVSAPDRGTTVTVKKWTR